MTHCTGLMGKRCTCGLYHSPEQIDTDNDFLRQQTVFHGLWLVGRWALLVIAIACAAMAVRGFFS